MASTIWIHRATQIGTITCTCNYQTRAAIRPYLTQQKW